jgi:hypothetical protein
VIVEGEGRYESISLYVSCVFFMNRCIWPNINRTAAEESSCNVGRGMHGAVGQWVGLGLGLGLVAPLGWAGLGSIDTRAETMFSARIRHVVQQELPRASSAFHLLRQCRSCSLASVITPLACVRIGQSKPVRPLPAPVPYNRI